jgi:hypothetical protein
MVTSMDTPFLTIAEASKKTGRSASTIRRLIHALTETDTHEKRSAIQPSPAEVAVFKQKGDTFTWRIREDVLMQQIGSALKEEKKEVSGSTDGILNILQKELDLKTQQIEKQWEVIHALNERLREGNILMGSLQKRLALPEVPAQPSSVVDASAAEMSKETSKVAVGSGKEKGSRRGLLKWFKS